MLHLANGPKFCKKKTEEKIKKKKKKKKKEKIKIKNLFVEGFIRKFLEKELFRAKVV
jgi:hypothetical protein